MLGVQCGDAGDGGVVLVEEDVDARVGQGMQFKVLGEGGFGLHFPEAVHEFGE